MARFEPKWIRLFSWIVDESLPFGREVFVTLRGRVIARDPGCVQFGFIAWLRKTKEIKHTMRNSDRMTEKSGACGDCVT